MNTRRYVLITLVVLLLLVVAGTLLPILRGNPPSSDMISEAFLAIVLVVAIIANHRSKAWSRV